MISLLANFVATVFGKRLQDGVFVIRAYHQVGGAIGITLKRACFSGPYLCQTSCTIHSATESDNGESVVVQYVCI